MIITVAQYLLYLKYMGLSILMVVLFASLYIRITPVKEISLIRDGNVACALSFGGALLGFSITLASSVVHTISIPSFLIWSLAATILQLLVYFIGTRLIKDASTHLHNNNIAVGALFGAMSLSIGILNAACLT
jgi:putative membrane protein